jgi:hypothetical protein
MAETNAHGPPRAAVVLLGLAESEKRTRQFFRRFRTGGRQTLSWPETGLLVVAKRTAATPREFVSEQGFTPQDRVYVAPSMIAHYVDRHSYVRTTQHAEEVVNWGPALVRMKLTPDATRLVVRRR